MNNKNYSIFNKIVLRCPLLPFAAINKINKEFLKEIATDKVFLEAIYLASPLLYDELQKWQAGKITKPKDEKRLKYSLLRYFTRMSTRCTPFGLFAGCTVGELKGEDEIKDTGNSDIILASQNKNKRCTRLDMNYLCALAQDLAKQPVIKGNLKYFPNSSIYALGQKLRYVQYHYKETRRKHNIIAVDNSEYLQTILVKAGQGAYLHELADELMQMGVEAEQANNFIEELITSQLLLSELEPAVTGEDLFEQIISIIAKTDSAEEIKNKLQKIHSAIKAIDNAEIGLPVEEYKKVSSLIEAMGIKFEAQYLFQTDMIKSSEKCYISNKIAEDVLAGIEALNKLTPMPAETNITRFRDAFYERYEGQEVPLLVALDTESGIGYIQGAGDAGDIAPLVDDVFIPNSNTAHQINWTAAQSFIISLYHKALKYNSCEITITDEDLKPFEAVWDDLPETIAAMIQLYKNKIIFSSANGPGAANLLGRFCYADSGIHDLVKEIIKKEEENNPDVIYAEIVHLPESRVGNILFRPVLRKYEIPYLAKPAVAKEFQLRLSDLMLSVKGNRIVLRSQRLNKEIIPRLSSAHNYSNNALPVYQFLCDLQTQNSRGGVMFSWGALQNEFNFMPRVTYRNLIFSLATWKVKKDDIKPMFAIEDDEMLICKINEWRQKNKIPAYVVLEDGDNELFIDLENPLLVRTLFSVIKNRDMFQLQEFLFDNETAAVKSDEGSFNNQIILAFYKNKQNKEVA